MEVSLECLVLTASDLRTLKGAPMELASNTTTYIPGDRRNAGSEPVNQTRLIDWSALPKLGGREKLALFLAAFMTLAPLAMAAWGAHFGV
jgi:hypothetical protein